MEHSPTSATGTRWEPTPWHATQRAAWEALEELVRSREVAGFRDLEVGRPPKGFRHEPQHDEPNDGGQKHPKHHPDLKSPHTRDTYCLLPCVPHAGDADGMPLIHHVQRRRYHGLSHPAVKMRF